jgi:arylsulfate sulfotransferase
MSLSRTVLASFAVVAVTGCSSASPVPLPGPPEGSGSAPQGSGDATLHALVVSSGSLVPEFTSSNGDYNITSLTSFEPIQVTATTNDPNATVTIQGASAKSGAATTLTLTPREDITVVVTSGETTLTYKVNYVPTDMPAYTVTKTAQAGNEDILLAPGFTYLLVIDRDGEPLWYRTYPQQSVEDLQQHVLPTGNVYSAVIGTANPLGWTLGAAHVFNAQFQETATVQMLAHADHGPLPAEAHDFMVLGDQHYVVETYLQRTIDMHAFNPAWSDQAPVMSCLVQEIDHGQVVFEWDSANDWSLYTDCNDPTNCKFTSSAVSDYLHLNAIDIDPTDGNFVFSFRHANAVVKVDRKTAQTIWTLGGKEDQFGLQPEQVFSHQHHARMHPDGTMTVFDNGNGLHQSRALQLTLDQANHKVLNFDVIYEKPTAQAATAFMGSVVPTDSSHVIIGWGGWLTMDLLPSVSEIMNGQPVWSLQFTAPAVFSYRALPITKL